MTQEHLFTPSDQLISDWCASKVHVSRKIPLHVYIATQAARWGADQELEACCEWVNSFQNKFIHAHDLRLVRRPKPPNLKEQALAALSPLNSGALCINPVTDKETIRRALESLPD